MSVFSFEYSSDNPVCRKTVLDLSESINVTTHERDIEDLTTLLAVFHDSAKLVSQMEDYYPSVDMSRFPRKDIQPYAKEDNDFNAWGCRFSIKDQETNRGLLAGKTVCVKDCVCVAGVPMLMGSNFVREYTPHVDATVVTRMLEAGAELVGKAICENMCHSATSHSAATGPIENPYAKGYSTGGSSSGTAALVAGNKVDLGIGADQGGSIRIPSGSCGIVGLKPTFGLVPFTGCASNEPTNDHVGPMTRTVLDNALLLQVIAGDDGIDDRGGFCVKGDMYHEKLLALGDGKISLEGMKIGILKEGMDNANLDAKMKACVKNAIEKFEELGAIVEEVSVPMHSSGTLIWTIISKVGGYLSKTNQVYSRRGLALNDLTSKYFPLSQDNWEGAYAATKNIILNGKYGLENFSELLGKATNLSRKLRDDYDNALEKFDLLVLPNIPKVASSNPNLDEFSTPLEVMGKQVGVSANTCPFNQTGHPVLALPCGMLDIEEGPLAGSGTKLPASLQIVGKWFDEITIYKAALAWEREYNWHQLP